MTNRRRSPETGAPKEVKNGLAPLSASRFTIDFEMLSHAADACILWRGSTDDWGYGIKGIRGHTFKVHRIVLEWKLGRQIRDGYLSLHTCDIPACYNPNHLWEGTHQENMDDMRAKGREPCLSGEAWHEAYSGRMTATGERHGSVTHPERLARGDKNGQRRHPERVAKGERHGSATRPERRPRGDRHGMRLHSPKLSIEKARRIRKLASTGMKRADIASEFGVSISMIYMIIWGKTWVDHDDSKKQLP